MEWTGFSDEDLQRLKTPVASQAKTSAIIQTGRLKVDNSSSRSARSRKTVKVVTFADDVRAEQLSANQRLAPPKTTQAPAQNGEPHQPNGFVSTETGLKNDTSSRDAVESENKAKNLIGTDASGENSVASKVAVDDVSCRDNTELNMDLDEQSIVTRELGNLEKFRNQQKMIEELNRRKKEMLTSAIQQRQRKAKVEAAKLATVKQELDHLDQLVSADVSIIRSKIELASRDFLEAQ